MEDPSQKPDRALLEFISYLFIAGGALCLLFGLLGAFVRIWTSAPQPAWSFIVLVVILFEGVLMISAGMAGRKGSIGSGSHTLGALVLSLSLGWLVGSIFGSTGWWWIPAAVFVASILYLNGLKRASRPPSPPAETTPEEQPEEEAASGSAPPADGQPPEPPPPPDGATPPET
ncbi:MAG: hypothetical protein HDQ87_02310 [Clostridia bacterium]|nr:hypothetical protein [Clostridia bacterium]